MDFYDKGQFENARLAFLQAYALKKHPAVLLNLAQSSAKAGHPLEAAKYFQQFLKESTTASPASRIALAVPPDAMISTLRTASPLTRSSSNFLSVTLISARFIGMFITNTFRV